MENAKPTPKSVRKFFNENKGTATICGDSIRTVSAITSYLTREGWTCHYLAVDEDICATLSNSHVLVVTGWDNYDEFIHTCIDIAVSKGIPVAQYKISWGFHPHPDSPPFQFPEDGLTPMMANVLSGVVCCWEEEQFNDAIYPLLRKGLPMHHLVNVLCEYVADSSTSLLDQVNETNSDIISQKVKTLLQPYEHLMVARKSLTEIGW